MVAVPGARTAPGVSVGPASCARLLRALRHVRSGLGRGEKQSTVVVADASCAPAKGGDAGGRFGIETHAAKSPVRGGGMPQANRLVLSSPAAFNLGACRCQILALNNALALSGSIVLCVSARFILYLEGKCARQRGAGMAEPLIRHLPAHKNHRGEAGMHLRSPGSGQNYRPASPGAPALRSARLKHVVLQAVGFFGFPPPCPFPLYFSAADWCHTDLAEGQQQFPKAD